jgi:4-hydroxy-tetrahydrodipicolinate reductase
VSHRVVVWGTGLVGKLVIAEILDHPEFDLVGVGVSNPEKVGKDAGVLAGGEEAGIFATDNVTELIDLAPDALAHYGPTAAHAEDNIQLIGAFLRSGIDVVSTAMTPWVWPAATRNPASWISPIEQACAEGGASCFTTGIDPGFANDLFPMTLMGLCGRVDSVRAMELVDYAAYTGDYEAEMGIGRAPGEQALLEIPDILIMAWGPTVPMIAAAAGIELDDITTTWEKWVTDKPILSAKGTIQPGAVAAIRFQIMGIHKGEPRIVLEHVNRIGHDAAPDWPRGNTDDCYRVEIEGSPSITQETTFRLRGADAATAGCLATGLRALNAIPAVIAAPPGWVTPLDLPLIPGRGTIR